MPRLATTRRRSGGPRSLVDRLARAAQRPQQETLPSIPNETPIEVEGEDETEWTTDAPLLTEAEGALLPTEIAARGVSEEDIDRLWDWIRADEDRGMLFLGMVPATSAELRARLLLFGEHLYALDEAGVHIGFGGFNPVTEQFAQMHLYLTSAARNQLDRLIPAFLSMAQKHYAGLTLTVLAPDLTLVRLYRRFGFQVRHILTWTPLVAEKE